MVGGAATSRAVVTRVACHSLAVYSGYFYVSLANFCNIHLAKCKKKKTVKNTGCGAPQHKQPRPLPTRGRVGRRWCLAAVCLGAPLYPPPCVRRLGPANKDAVVGLSGPFHCRMSAPDRGEPSRLSRCLPVYCFLWMVPSPW